MTTTFLTALVTIAFVLPALISFDATSAAVHAAVITSARGPGDFNHKR
jgi:hypothetical protein